ncbi:MAG: hypothetical protein NVSMB52_20070 [Chloroflexota bacterium]
MMQPSQSILVVDDDADLRSAIRWALEDEGYSVETASDGREALDRGVAHRPSLVVLDMGLPIVNGTGVADGLKAAHGDTIPILVVTADGKSAEKARRVGAFDYLHKPFNLDDLVARVKTGLS